ncbi:MAG: hypothetical protein Q9183_005726 [Haloplaca sp. 2 TL-2023]
MKDVVSPHEVISHKRTKIFLALCVDQEKNVSATCSINADDASGMANSVSYESTTTARPVHKAIINAYRLYFGTFYHVPLQIPVETAPFEALDQLHCLANIGDFLGGIEPLVAPVKAFICPQMPVFLHQAVTHWPTFLEIAQKLKISWLFKDMVCIAVGDHSREDGKLSLDFDSEIASLILEKRKLLRTMIEEINIELLTMDFPNPGTPSATRKVHAAREAIVKLVKRSRASPWDQYAQVYVTLVNRKEIDDLAGESGTVTWNFYDEVSNVISPLLNVLVSPFWALDPTVDSEHPSLMCVACGDEDLPWNR